MMSTTISEPETQSAKSAPSKSPNRSRLRIAFLTTEYPKVSHTFIRREILGLEAIGYDILRLAIRDSGGAVADPVDQQEASRTLQVLNQSKLKLLWNATVTKLSHPIRWIKASMMMWRMSKASERGLLRHLAYLLEAAYLVRIVKKHEIAHIHVHFGTNAAAVARLMRCLGGPTYSMMVHGPDEFDAAHGFSLRGKIEDALFVTGISDFCRAQLRRWVEPEHWEKIHIVRCTVGEAFFDAAQPIPADSKQLVCVGRLSAEKCQLLLVRAMAELRDEGVDGSLVLAGDGPIRSLIDKTIAELDLADRVTVTGWIDEQQVRQHLLASRALILPSAAEGLPVVIMEALALRRPVLSTFIAGIPELVADGVNGWLIPSGNTEALTNVMEEVLAADIDMLNAMGAAGQQRVREQHHTDTEVRKLADLFERYVMKGPSP